MDRGFGQATVHRVPQSRTRLKQRSSRSILPSQQRKQGGRKREKKLDPPNWTPGPPGPSTSIHNAWIIFLKCCLHCGIVLFNAFNSKQNLYHVKQRIRTLGKIFTKNNWGGIYLKKLTQGLIQRRQSQGQFSFQRLSASHRKPRLCSFTKTCPSPFQLPLSPHPASSPHGSLCLGSCWSLPESPAFLCPNELLASFRTHLRSWLSTESVAHVDS